MKCPACGGAPDNMVLTSNPLKYRCSECDYVGTRGPWMASAKKARVEKLQAARNGVELWMLQLTQSGGMGAHQLALISNLIKAHIELALLERGS